jgi:hypothetical protein
MRSRIWVRGLMSIRRERSGTDDAFHRAGQVQESVQWYVKAVEINPDFPEAVCGLVNALGGICNWNNRGAVGDDLGVDDLGNPLYPGTPAHREKAKKGWMVRINTLVRNQLAAGMSYGSGVIRSSGGADYWLRIISSALYGSNISSSNLASWRRRLQRFEEEFDRGSTNTNEGGFLIRLIELLIRRTQRRWYVEKFGKVVDAGPGTLGPRVMPTQGDFRRYPRPPIPPSLPPTSVPTVLPFHTFTYPLSARDIRLISHRNALRITHTTLSQPWLPPHVYPPPPPPAGKLNIGYVSSDLCVSACLPFLQL